jgi:hypothetical protein
VGAAPVHGSRIGLALDPPYRPVERARRDARAGVREHRGGAPVDQSPAAGEARRGRFARAEPRPLLTPKALNALRARVGEPLRLRARTLLLALLDPRPESEDEADHHERQQGNTDLRRSRQAPPDP